MIKARFVQYFTLTVKIKKTIAVIYKINIGIATYHTPLLKYEYENDMNSAKGKGITVLKATKVTAPITEYTARKPANILSFAIDLLIFVEILSFCLFFHSTVQKLVDSFIDIGCIFGLAYCDFIVRFIFGFKVVTYVT